MDFNNYDKEVKQIQKEMTMTDKASKGLMNNIGSLVIFAISIVWLFYGFFKPSLSDIPWYTRLSSSLLSIVVAVTISSMLGLQGLLKGSKLEDIIELQRLHRETTVKANEYSEYADEWSDLENAATLKRARTHLLSTAGLKYSEFFDDEGNFTDKEVPEPTIITKDTTKYYDDRVKKLHQAISLRITPLTFAVISNDSKVDYDEHKFSSTPTEFHRAQTVKKVMSKVLTVTLLGLVTFKLIEGQNVWESLFNGALQLAMFLIFGVTDYLKNYNYVKDVYSDNLRRKISAGNRLIAFGKRKRGATYGEL